MTVRRDTSLPTGIEDAAMAESRHRTAAEAVETGSVSSRVSDSASSASSAPQLDTTSFNPGTVSQHYSTQVGQLAASSTPAASVEEEDAARRDSVDDVFSLIRHQQKQIPKRQANTTSDGEAKGFFTKNEQFNVDQSVNFMDHRQANYTPPPTRTPRFAPTSRSGWGRSTKSRRGASFVDIFLSRRGSSTTARSSTITETIQEGDERKPSIWPRIAAWILIFLCVGAGAAALALSVPHLHRHDSDQEDPAEREIKIKNKIVESGVTLNSVLTNPNSPQHYAWNWMTHTDKARMRSDDPGLLTRYALAVFYYTNHPNIAAEHSSGKRELTDSDWNKDDGWMTKVDVCKWHGIICGTVNEGHENSEYGVIHWNMTDNKLKGTIPAELAALSDLVSLDFSTNRLAGPVPTSVLDLPYLKQIILRDNALSGTVPVKLGYAYAAEDIDLSENRIQGSLPTSLNTLVNLRRLSLRANDLEGSIPDMSRLSKLVDLNLDENQIIGSFPETLAHLPSLERLSMEHNGLAGTLPESIRALTNLKLLAIGHNSFTGNIPEVFSNLHNLTEIRLQKNLFEHRLPTSLGRVTGLKQIMIDSNNLVGPIPAEWMELTELEGLVLHDNDLSGELPSKLGSELKCIQDLWLNGNRFSGSIPTSIGLLTDVETIYLEDNPLEGGLPTEMGRLSRLQALRLAGTHLKGAVPLEVCELKVSSELEYLSASCSGLKCVCCDKCS